MPRLAALSSLLLLALGLACESGPPAPASVRIAHFVPDVPGNGAIDVCLKPDGTAAFSTRFVQQGGLTFASLSSRTDVDAGTYSLRVVGASATDCSTSLNGLGDVGGIALGEGGAYTVALVGLLGGTGNGSVAVRTYVDDTAAPASPAVKLRFVHVSPELGGVDLGALSGATFLPLNPAVTLGYPADSQYFVYPGGVTGANLAIVDTGTTNLRLSGQFSVPGGTADSVFIVGRPTQTSGDPRLSFLLCPESGTPSCLRFP